MNWYHGSVAEAVAEAKRSNKLFLVYIEGNDDMSKKMTDTYNDPAIAEKLSTDSIIALKLVANSVPFRQFCAVYPVLVIPSSFFLGENGAPIEIITGSLSPDEFSNKLEKLLEICEKAINKKIESSASCSTSPPATLQENNISAPTVTQNEDPEPSTSQTATAAESLQEKVERAKILVEAQRQQKAQEEKEKERREEIERRNIGKAIQQAEQTKQDNELKEWAKNRAKDKEEERQAREKVKAMIAQDRAERAAKYQQTKVIEQDERERLARKREEAERAMRNAAMSSNDARIQFRMPDGSFTTHSFSADATLEDARRFVIEVVRPPFTHFSLCTTFPRRHFTESNYSESLRDLQLAPSAVLLILPEQAVTSIRPGTGFISNLFWTLMSPITTVWNFIRSFFPGSAAEPNRSTRSQSPPEAQPASPSTNQPPNNTRQSNQGQRPSTFAKREGNVFRINNQSDDDENNTWNGNSTQQM